MFHVNVNKSVANSTSNGGHTLKKGPYFGMSCDNLSSLLIKQVSENKDLTEKNDVLKKRVKKEKRFKRFYSVFLVLVLSWCYIK